MILAVGLTVAAGTMPSVAYAADEPKTADRDARQTVEAYLAAVLAGKVEKAAALTLPRSVEGSKKRIDEYRQRVVAKNIKLASTHVSAAKGRAFVVTEVVQLVKDKPDDPDKGALAIKLSKTDGHWLVRDVDVTTKEVAKQQLKQFLQKYQDAKAVPEKQVEKR